MTGRGGKLNPSLGGGKFPLRGLQKFPIGNKTSPPSRQASFSTLFPTARLP
jgi:hypothetical protein